MTLNAPVLQTDRLILRPPVADDFEDFIAFGADPETMRHLGGVQSRPVAWRSFVGVVGSWHVRGYAFFSVLEKATGRWVGRLGPWQPEGWPGTEIGWGIARPFWGRGYAPEAAAAATDWAFDQLGWSEVIHTIGAANAASKAVAVKLGSRYLRQGRLPAPLDLDVEIWGQSREDWHARRAGAQA